LLKESVVHRGGKDKRKKKGGKSNGARDLFDGLQWGGREKGETLKKIQQS